MSDFKGPKEKMESRITREGMLYPWDTGTLRKKGERGEGDDMEAAALTSTTSSPQASTVPY